MSDLAHFWATLHPLVATLCIAAAVACVVNLVLRLLPGPRASLPHPSKIGLPMAATASVTAAHAALSRRGAAARPKFYT
jgi:hypothetical protein